MVFHAVAHRGDLMQAHRRAPFLYVTTIVLWASAFISWPVARIVVR